MCKACSEIPRPLPLPRQTHCGHLIAHIVKTHEFNTIYYGYTVDGVEAVIEFEGQLYDINLKPKKEDKNG